MDGGVTWTLPSGEMDERVRVRRTLQAFKSLRSPQYQQYARLVAHEDGDELLSRQDVRPPLTYIPSVGGLAAFPVKYQRNRMGPTTYLGGGDPSIINLLSGVTLENTQQTGAVEVSETEQILNSKLNEFKTAFRNNLRGHLEIDLAPTCGPAGGWTPEFNTTLNAQIEVIVDAAGVYYGTQLAELAA